jgi:hypothetical protein
MHKYHSKIGIGILVFVTLILGGSTVLMIANQAWLGLAINTVVVGFFVYLFATTYYIISGKDLIVKSGFLINLTIKIESITKIVETNNPISSPAVSLDRIAIYFTTPGLSYTKSDSVMISPRRKMEFIRQLTALNSKIEVVLKNDIKTRI